MKNLFVNVKILLAALILTCSYHTLSANFNAKYEITNLISNTSEDSRLVNPWGLYINRHTSLFIADNQTNMLTAYDKHGDAQNIQVVVIAPTGLIYNDSDHHFIIPNTEFPAKFLIASETGKIFAYNRDENPNNAVPVINRSSFNSVYTGIALGENQDQHYIFATDFFNGKVDIFDTHFNYVSSFTDPEVPAGFAPFNIRKIHHHLYVTYAKQNETNHAIDAPGAGNGFVSIFEMDGTFIRQLISHDLLNSPWGIAQSTRKFGKFSHTLLVGNVGDGTIHAYDIDTGTFVGTLKDKHGHPLFIDGLRALIFKSHESSDLYFTSGPNQGNGGLVGKIEALDIH